MVVARAQNPPANISVRPATRYLEHEMIWRMAIANGAATIGLSRSLSLSQGAARTRLGDHRIGVGLEQEVRSVRTAFGYISYTRDVLPPGPSSHPLFNLVRWVRAPLPMLEQLAATYGSAFSMRTSRMPEPHATALAPDHRIDSRRVACSRSYCNHSSVVRRTIELSRAMVHWQ